MTLVIWAACDAFSLLVADRRSISGTIDGVGLSGELLLSNKKVSDTEAKVSLSADGTEAFGVAGFGLWLRKVLVDVGMLRGFDVEEQLHVEFSHHMKLDRAHLSNLMPAVNTVLHCYSRDGKMVCGRLDGSPFMLSTQILVGGNDHLTIAAAGSGAPHLMELDREAPDHWKEIASRTDDWNAVRLELLQAVRLVAERTDGVSPDADSWLFAKERGAWVPIDGAIDPM